MTEVRSRAVATALVAATIAAACGDDGGPSGPVYESAEQMADALGCGDSFEIDRPPDLDPNQLVLAGSAVEVGTCVLAGSRVMLRVSHAAGADDESGAAFEAFWCLGEPTDSSDHHYAEGRGWVAMPADPGDVEQAATLAELLGGRVAGFGCAE